MAAKRLFTGIFIDCGIFEDIYPEIKSDFEPAVSGKWVEPDNLHFTLKFLGDTDVEIIDDIKESLADLTAEINSPLFLKGMRAFPNLKRPRVLVVPVFNPDRELFRIHADMESRLEQFGFERERRKFQPHMTLMRIKSFADDVFQDIAKKYSAFEFGEMTHFRVNLIESHLSKSGPTYKIIA
ncbi:MAG: RNA 2',3'-cyclic phosphodiesterase [Candidatus Kapaibacterium sp.]